MTTMKNTLKISILFLVLACLAFGQTTISSTTLSSAVTSPFPASSGTPPTRITLASVSGMTAQTLGGFQTYLYIDKELMGYASLSSGTTANVVRGLGGTLPANHASGAKVWYAPQSAFLMPFNTNTPIGPCTAAQLQWLPIINVLTGNLTYCSTTGATYYSVAAGAASRTISSFCTGTAGSAETEFLNDAACSGATTATKRSVIATAGTLANLQVFSSAAFTGGTNKDVITVLKNGSNTTITCTAIATATTCSDVAHSVAVAAGDVITFSFVSATSDTAANVSVGLGVY
jgi:hypothetical protein